MVSELLTLTEYQAILRTQELAVIHFFAKWSPPCRQIYPQFQKMESEFRPHISFYRVDIDIAPEISRTAKVQGVPTFVFYKRGDSVNILEGGDETDLFKKLKELSYRTS
jgi:thioredoxin 1